MYKILFNRYFAVALLMFAFLVTHAQVKNPHNLPYKWKTDTSKSNVALSDLSIATVKDGILTMNYPEFIHKNDKGFNYYEFEPVICINFNGVAKAYPLSLLTMYELANDSCGGEQIMVTYCPMCNAAMVFNRRVKWKDSSILLNFGISGLLMHNDMIMYDRQTETWWEQLMGEAIVGEMAGTELKMMRALIISVKDYFDRFPDGLILAPVTIKEKDKRNKHRPFYHMDHNSTNFDSAYFLPEVLDKRLPPLERVLDIHVEGHTKIYPFEAIRKKQVINEVFDNMAFVIFYHDETVSVLDEDNLSASRKTGSATAFRSYLDGVNLTFKKEGDYFKDEQTGSIWDITGFCRDGVSKGKQLWILPHSNHFAFAYLAFFPDSEIYESE
ncbi:MAG: DUF3179 domain-containing protein [Flavobacteriales bacterium]|nr:DUF3179 domain-containing protein [Flavobacteriales bacterium]